MSKPGKGDVVDVIFLGRSLTRLRGSVAAVGVGKRRGGAGFSVI